MFTLTEVIFWNILIDSALNKQSKQKYFLFNHPKLGQNLSSVHRNSVYSPYVGYPPTQKGGYPLIVITLS